jgi:AcrR family transcriptional regulator
MDLMSDGVKRQYRSSARAEAAAETAERIREAARQLFVAQGYTATTLKQVAERAGVGERTVYDAYGGKLRLLNHAIGHLALGDGDRTPISERAEVRRARDHDDPWTAVAETMRYQAALMERAGDLILVAEEASRADAAVGEKSRVGYELARQTFVRLAERLEERGELRDGVDAAMASDSLFVLASPQVFDLLRRRRRWPAHRYREWTVEMAHLQLLPAATSDAGDRS